MKITMIGGVFACCAFLSVSCRENVKSDAPDHDATASIEDSENSSSEEIDRQITELRRHSDREFFYRKNLSIAQVLGIPDDITANEIPKPIITDAFILSVGDNGSVKTIEHICGRLLFNHKDFLPSDAAPGEYLVGRLMPRGGWTLGGRRDSGVFCCPMLSDDTFSYGFEAELVGQLESIKKLKDDTR